ncbi:TPA: CRISPR-associated endoribonuclease Cas6 [Candidatus Micrarchaeota archaeon]|nr:CRISPR-associated endoribonuclease Cas6 [Candidatus Micrarchaeota archaeon]
MTALETEESGESTPSKNIYKRGIVKVYTVRVKISITPEEDFAWSEINQNLLVGLVWNLIKGTGYEILHDQRGFKFFTFSEIFPFGDFKKDEAKSMIISSPDPRFAEKIAEKIGDCYTARLGSHPVTLSTDKVFRIRPSSTWEAGSPVVVRLDSGRYWREDQNTLGEFIRLLEQNAVAKYRAYTGDQAFGIEFPLFEQYEFVKGVVHSFRKGDGQRVMIIGSKWRFGLPKGWKMYREFYSFLMDCGIGEKNAMGYGFVNPVRGGGKGD